MRFKSTTSAALISLRSSFIIVVFRFGDTKIAIISREPAGVARSDAGAGATNNRKLELYENKIAVTVEELTRDDDGPAVMSKMNYDKLVLRKRITVLRRACRCTYALIEYRTLPDRFRERYEAKYGDPEELLREEQLAVEISEEARAYFAGVRGVNGQELTCEKIEEYTLNASVLDHLAELVKGQRGGRKRAGQGTALAWQNIHAESEALRKRLGHTLPKGVESLKNKIRAYTKNGYECLISGKLMTTNRQKITEEAGRFLVALRRSRKPVYTLKGMLERFNEEAAVRGWKTLASQATIKAYLSRPEIEPKWYAAVHGELEAKQRFDRKHRTLLPQRRDSLWYGDGTKLNLYYKGFDSKGCPSLRTLMVYEVIDAFSEMLLGYAIGTTENAAMQRRAFRMAVETAGCKPYEIVTDNQGGQKNDAATKFTSRLCRVRRFTAPYTPQAKSIEQLFGRFQSQVLAQDWAYTGGNITCKTMAAKPNREFIADNFAMLYTYEELLEAYAEFRQVWNDMPRPGGKVSRREAYLSSENPEAVPLTQADYIDLFWEQTEKPSEYTSSGIEIQIDNQKYAYEVFDGAGIPDYEFNSRNIGRKFYVRFDREDMTRVWLYEETPSGLRRVRSAEPYATIHRALQEQTATEQDFIRETVEANKRARVRRQQEGYDIEAQFGLAPEQNGLRTPKLRGISDHELERLHDQAAANSARTDAERLADTALPDDEEDAACEPIDVGPAGKGISNLTYDKVQTFDSL